MSNVHNFVGEISGTAGAYTAAPLPGGHIDPAVTRSRAHRLRDHPRTCPGPRIVHQFLPIPDKGMPDWGYAWIP